MTDGNVHLGIYFQIPTKSLEDQVALNESLIKTRDTVMQTLNVQHDYQFSTQFFHILNFTGNRDDITSVYEYFREGVGKPQRVRSKTDDLSLIENVLLLYKEKLVSIPDSEIKAVEEMTQEETKKKYPAREKNK